MLIVCVYPLRTREDESQTDVAHMSSVVNLLLSSEVNVDIMQFKHISQRKRRRDFRGSMQQNTAERSRGRKETNHKNGRMETEEKIIMQQKTSGQHIVLECCTDTEGSSTLTLQNRHKAPP